MTGLHGGGIRCLVVPRGGDGNDGPPLEFPDFDILRIDLPDEGFPPVTFAMNREFFRNLMPIDDLNSELAQELIFKPALAAGLSGYQPIFKGTTKVGAIDEGLIGDLADRMFEVGPDALSATGAIPAAYTYIGQFIAHDLSRMQVVGTSAGPNLVTPALDLSSIFDLATGAFVPGGALLGPTTPGHAPNDLPRAGGRVPDIPDRRNDANLAVAQVQVMLARLYLHLAPGHAPGDAATVRVVQNLFQFAVLNSYLKTVAGPAMAAEMLYPPKVLRPVSAAYPFIVPLEFALAFFRFGHAMVRGKYVNWDGGTASVSPSALWNRTHHGPDLPILDSWVMPWDAMFTTNFARGIGARLTRTLESIPVMLTDNAQAPRQDGPGPLVVSLARETLLRGSRLGLATSQDMDSQISAVLSADGGPHIDLYDNTVLQKALGGAAASLMPFLKGPGTAFRDMTPLWLYTLLEAQFYTDGRHLGPMAGRIVCETLCAAIAADSGGILGKSMGFDPSHVGIPAPPDGDWFRALVGIARQPLP